MWGSPDLPVTVDLTIQKRIIKMKELTAKQNEFVEDLLSRMTLEEKIGQLNQASVSIVGGFDVSFPELIEMNADGRISNEEFQRILSNADRDYHEEEIRKGLVGSMMVSEPHDCNRLQKIAVEESRLGIPLIFGLDVIHGFRSVYPIAIAEAGAFDTDLFARTAAMAARESRTQGVAWHFAPMLDIARDARWGRVSEGPGEDRYLASAFAAAKVHGLQDDHSSTENYVAACMKHYMGYGACESGRDYNTTSIAPHLVYNHYLAPFAAGAKAGAKTVMASFNDLNGVPCTANSWTLRKILKGDLDFEGFVVSDANAIREVIVHGYAEDEKDAGIKSVNAGLDMDMGTEIYLHNLAAAIEEGSVKMEVLDDAVRRILSVKVWLGLFDHPYTEEAAMHRYDVLPAEHLALAEEAAVKSAVLLKNGTDGTPVLPLAKDAKVSLLGTLADDKENIIGAWAMSWREEDCVTIRAGMEEVFPSLQYFKGFGPATAADELDAARKDIDDAVAYGDVIVAALGEPGEMSGEASSRASIIMPGCQRQLLGELMEKSRAAGKKLVLLAMNGRPLDLSWETEHVDAILEGWQLGIRMGSAVAKLLSGDAAPEGRLASTFPACVGQCPIYYSHPNTGRPGSRSKFTSRYLDAPYEPLYPFGYGLTYTQFEYSDASVTEKADSFDVSVKVTNTGSRNAVETVQLYMQDVSASLVRPVRELKGFAKTSPAPGSSETVTISLAKKDMGFYDNEGTYLLEDGKFRFYIGANSRDAALAAEINVKF